MEDKGCKDINPVWNLCCAAALPAWVCSAAGFNVERHIAAWNCREAPQELNNNNKVHFYSTYWKQQLQSSLQKANIKTIKHEDKLHEHNSLDQVAIKKNEEKGLKKKLINSCDSKKKNPDTYIIIFISYKMLHRADKDKNMDIQETIMNKTRDKKRLLYRQKVKYNKKSSPEDTSTLKVVNKKMPL